MTRKTQIVVIGDSREIDINNKAAYEMGCFIAENGWVTLTGGNAGVMQAASKGANESGGLVISILPGEDIEAGNPYAHIKIPTGIGFARNSTNVLSGDVIVAIGGGTGTLGEISYAWCYKKPIIAAKWCDGWSAKVAGTKIDPYYDNEVIEAIDIADLKAKLKSEVEKIFK